MHDPDSVAARLQRIFRGLRVKERRSRFAAEGLPPGGDVLDFGTGCRKARDLHIAKGPAIHRSPSAAISRENAHHVTDGTG